MGPADRQSGLLEACRLTHAAGGRCPSHPIRFASIVTARVRLIADEVDILFANTDELTALHETDDLSACGDKEWVDIAAVTRGPTER